MTNLDRRAFLATGASAGLPGMASSATTWTLDQSKPGHTKNTKFAINIEMWRFGVRTRAERIRKVAELGFQHVEFWGRPEESEVS